MYWRDAGIRRPFVWIGIRSEQRSDDGGVAVATRKMKRCISTESCACLDIGAGNDKHLGEFYVAPFRSPVQCRHAITMALVDVRTATQLLTDRCNIAALGCIRDGSHRRTADACEKHAQQHAGRDDE
jgi:hypothetical protein